MLGGLISVGRDIAVILVKMLYSKQAAEDLNRDERYSDRTWLRYGLLLVHQAFGRKNCSVRQLNNNDSRVWELNHGKPCSRGIPLLAHVRAV